MFLIILQETLSNGYKAEYLDLISLISIFFGVSIIISKNPILSVLSRNSPAVPYAFVCLPLHSGTVWFLVLANISYIIKRIRLILDIMIKNILIDTVKTLINLEYVFFRADSAFFVLIIKQIIFILDKSICNIFKITLNTLKILGHVFFKYDLALFALTLFALGFGGVIWYKSLLPTGLLIIANKLIDLLLTSICLFFLITIYVYINYINEDFKIRYPYLYFVLNGILIIVIAIGLVYLYNSFLSLIDELYIEIYKLYDIIEKLFKGWVYVNGKGKAPWYQPESTNPPGPGGPNNPGSPGGPNSSGSIFTSVDQHQQDKGEDPEGNLEQYFESSERAKAKKIKSRAEKDDINENRRINYAWDIELGKDTGKQYRESHKDEKKESNARYYETHRDEIKEKLNKHRAENIDEARLNERESYPKRKQQKIERKAKLTDIEIEQKRQNCNAKRRERYEKNKAKSQGGEEN